MPKHHLILSLVAVVAAGCAASDAPRPGPDPLDARSAPIPAAPSSVVAAQDFAPFVDPTEPLAALEHQLLANHGDIEQLRLRARAERERARGARSWPDPRLTYREYLVEVETRVGPQERAFGLEQPIPWPGLLDDRSEGARIRSSLLEHDAERVRRSVLAMLRSRWAEYYYLGRAIVIREETLRLLERFEAVARDRLIAGRASSSDVIRVQLEVARIENELATLEERRDPLRLSILAFVGDDFDRPLPFPDSLPSRAAPPDEVLAGGVGRDPVIARAAGAVDLAENQLELAGYEGLPKLGVGVQTILTGSAVAPGVSGSGDDPWIVGLQLQLPLDRRRVRSAERAARDDRDATRAALRQLERDRAAELESALFARRDALRRIALHESTLIPKSEESLAATEAAFTGGEVDFSSWIEAERALLGFRLGEARARADQLIAEAHLRTFVGEDFAPERSAP